MWSSVLATLALGLATLVTLLVIAVLVNRVLLARDRDAERGAWRAGPMLHAWAAEGAVDALALALRELPARHARVQLALLTATRLPAATAAALGALVRDATWAREAMSGAGSRRWTRRLEAARLLPALGDDGDAATVRRLLADPHVAVRAAATAAIPRLADDALVGEVVRALPSQPEALRRLQAQTVRARWQTAERALVECLRANAATNAAAPDDADALAVWVAAAATLATPAALAACVPHHTHPSPAVRTEVARALGPAFSPEAFAALVTLLDDRSDPVRAEAARAVATYGARSGIVLPRLVALLGDRAWSVRYRAALALATLGEPGRRALRGARSAHDRFARDMAALVAGLPEGTVLELADT